MMQKLELEKMRLSYIHYYTLFNNLYFVANKMTRLITCDKTYTLRYLQIEFVYNSKALLIENSSKFAGK